MQGIRFLIRCPFAKERKVRKWYGGETTKVDLKEFLKSLWLVSLMRHPFAKERGWGNDMVGRPWSLTWKNSWSYCNWWVQWDVPLQRRRRWGSDTVGRPQRLTHKVFLTWTIVGYNGRCVVISQPFWKIGPTITIHSILQMQRIPTLTLLPLTWIPLNQSYHTLSAPALAFTVVNLQMLNLLTWGLRHLILMIGLHSTPP